MAFHLISWLVKIPMQWNIQAVYHQYPFDVKYSPDYCTKTTYAINLRGGIISNINGIMGEGRSYMDLQNLIAIVTGAGQGIGRGIAEKLASCGAAVVAANRTESKAEDTAQIIRARGGKALAVRADISINDDIVRMFDFCEENFGAPDILIANAGIAYHSAITETTEEEFFSIYNVNAKGTFFCLKEAGLRLKDGGRIVTISSSTATFSRKGMSLYSSTKAAICKMTEIAAQEFADRRINVNCVLPGITKTPAIEKDFVAGDISGNHLQMVIDNTPFKRLGTTEDIAEIVAFLCGNEAVWVNGKQIVVDGGAGC